MAYAITQSCCKDASCVSVCPVDCIHPTPDEPDFGTAELLYIDPKVCIDCGACADACPVAAPKAIDLLRGGEEVFAELNARYYETKPEHENPRTHTWDIMGGDLERRLSVAIVGTGPAAAYTARELLLSTDARITMIDRLPVPGGLVRGGVAPDHVDTKKFSSLFHWAYKHPRTTMVMNVEVGRDITHEEVLRHHDVVVYGVGARLDRPLGVAGEDLPGVLAAPTVVGWYNGALDIPAADVVIEGDRVVIVGNGNVALDLARLLLEDPDVLARTDMADHAVAAFRELDVREVVLLGRRGPSYAAFTRPELLMMPPGIEVVVARDGLTETELAEAEPDSNAETLARLPLVDLDLTAPPEGARRLMFAFGRQVVGVEGESRVEAVRIAPTGSPDEAITVPCGTLIRSTGHRGAPVPDLPFDEATSTVPHERGRVMDPASLEPVPGTYVVGWIKRGALGGIGANRVCAHETVSSIIADANAGRIPAAPRSRRLFGAFVRSRVDGVVGRRRMLAIEQAEERRGRHEGRPRVKFESVDEMLKVSTVTGVH